jgi:anti-anti-sigma factor
MSELAISVHEGDHGARVVVNGDLDLPAGDALEALVTPMLGPEAQIEIETTGVDFVDSSGLGALLAISQKATEAGGRIVLRQPSEAVSKILDLTLTTDMFTVEEAGGS